MDCNTLIVIIIFCREPIFITFNHYKIRWLMVSNKATLLIYKLIIGNKINEREMQYLEYMMCRILIDQQKTLSLRIN